MKIVMLDKKTLGDDCDLSELQKMGDFIAYDETDKNHTIERIKDADAVFTNKVVIGKDEIDNASNLKYIGIMATGTNNIDLEYAGNVESQLQMLKDIRLKLWHSTHLPCFFL